MPRGVLHLTEAGTKRRASLLVLDSPASLAALDRGADDYLSKPFNLGELLARLVVGVILGQRGMRPQAGALG